MYEFIKGMLVEVTAAHAVVEAGGVGYKILVPLNLMSRAPRIGLSILLYTTCVIREQSHTLVGFLEREERNFFDKLIGFSGIGPKIALSLIGHMGLSGLQQAVAAGQSAPFAKVPGVGKKTAERLLIELKGKVPVACLGLKHGMSDALQALLNLGYAQNTAYQAICQAEKEIGNSDDLSTLIACAIRLSST